jgi:hypothetical protein
MLCTEKTVLRDTVRLLAFSQLVLIFCAGAIPSPFKVIAFVPLFILAGAGAFWATSRVLWLFSAAGKPVNPVVTEQPHEHPGEVLAFPKSA